MTVHLPHGQRGGGNLHTEATGSDAGFVPAAGTAGNVPVSNGAAYVSSPHSDIVGFQPNQFFASQNTSGGTRYLSCTGTASPAGASPIPNGYLVAAFDFTILTLVVVLVNVAATGDATLQVEINDTPVGGALTITAGNLSGSVTVNASVVATDRISIRIANTAVDLGTPGYRATMHCFKVAP